MKAGDLKTGKIYRYCRFGTYMNVMCYGPDGKRGYGFRNASKKTGRYDDGVYQVLSAKEVEVLITEG
jgi:hypothetical protein